MFFLAFFIVILDQITKKLAVRHLKGQEPKVIIKNFFELAYVENEGAAFGILKGRQWFFFLVTIIVTLAIIYTLYRYGDELGPLFKFSMVLILAGSIGNFIDRLLYNHVVDFLSFNFGSYSFPLFNVADIAVTIGAGLIIIMILLGKVEFED